GRSGHDALGRAPLGHPQARAADLRHHRHSAVLRRAAHLDPPATAAGHRHDPQRPAHRPLARPDPAVPTQPEHLGWNIALMLGGVVLNGAASAMYIGSQFGPGPRDGLMTGLSRVTGASIRLVR